MSFMRKLVIALLFLLAGITGYSQTLFTYGNNQVSKEEFLRAYNKNNTGAKPSLQSYKDYLELYTRFKVKVQAALDAKLDTLANQKAELQGFRNQVVESYMKDDESINALIDEAFERSQKDIHLGSIFVACKNTATEEEVKKAKDKINNIYSQLQKGDDFSKLAQTYSEDPGAKFNKGDVGWITVFVLPYELESLAYSTPVNKYSAPYRSKAGFHIFKNLGERKPLGKIRLAQILFAFPPSPSMQQQQEVKQNADSVYNLLQKGGDFKDLAAKFSGDNLTYQSGGELAEFGVGRYDPAFESAAFALAKDGDISKPVITEYGYHIIKRLGYKPIPTDKNDKLVHDDLKQQVQQSDRMEVSKNVLYKKIVQLTHFKKMPVNENHLWAFTDSVLRNSKTPAFTDLNESIPLLSFTKQTIRLKDYQGWLMAMHNFPNMIAGKTKPQLYDQYIETTAFEYYRNHLEDYNKDFAYQLNEFKEGNLLFEIMQRKVWDVASSDSAGLKNYYDGHKDKYWWETSADAIIFTASNEAAATEAKKKLAANYKDWKKYIENSDGKLQGDSGRFELSQIPVAERTNFTEGLITANVKNETDNTITFAYIIKIHKEKEPRNFADARGFVINDYQVFLEDKWVADLKKKYPIVVNEATLRSLPLN